MSDLFLDSRYKLLGFIVKLDIVFRCVIMECINFFVKERDKYVLLLFLVI